MPDLFAAIPSLTYNTLKPNQGLFVEEHPIQWQQLLPMIERNQIPQSILLVGPPHTNKLQFANHFIATVICEDKKNRPCGQCKSCTLRQNKIHPDIVYVGEEPDAEKSIKIDHIRSLQQDSFQTPKCGEYRFYIIEPADKLNVYVANALLKTLEEPSRHSKFILLAEQVSSVLPTILSRCQRYTFDVPNLHDYLLLGSLYPGQTVRRELFSQIDSIVEKLCELVEKRVSPSTLASLWNSIPLSDLLWLFYLLTAEAIQYTARGSVNEKQPWTDKLRRFSSLSSVPTLFKQIDKINVLVRKINHNINMNSTLAVEDLLMGYLR